MEKLLERFLRYVKVDTQSLEDTGRSPSTPGQTVLAEMLADELRALGAEISAIRCLGGASSSPLWLQIKADVLNLPLAVPECQEATALGAAILGGAARDDFTTREAVARMVRLARTVEPGPDAALYEKCFQDYRKLDQRLMPTFGGHL